MILNRSTGNIIPKRCAGVCYEHPSQSTLLSKLQLPRDLKTHSHALLCLIHRIKNKTLSIVSLATSDTSENLTHIVNHFTLTDFYLYIYQYFVVVVLKQLHLLTIQQYNLIQSQTTKTKRKYYSQQSFLIQNLILNIC